MLKLAPVVGSYVYVRPTTQKAIQKYGETMVKAEVIENYMGLPEAYRVRFPDGFETTYIGQFVDLTV